MVLPNSRPLFFVLKNGLSLSLSESLSVCLSFSPSSPWNYCIVVVVVFCPPKVLSSFLSVCVGVCVIRTRQNNPNINKKSCKNKKQKWRRKTYIFFFFNSNVFANPEGFALFLCVCVCVCVRVCFVPELKGL